MDNRITLLVLVLLLSSFSCAQETGELLAGIEAHIGVMLLIALMVIIALMILSIFYLHNIAEHLNWIRRVR